MVILIRRNLIDLPINYSVSYYWSVGFVLSMFMIIQILTGVLLSFLYIGDYKNSFFMVMRLSNDSFFIWCLRYWHIIGVNLLFILIFVHMLRSLYYSGYNKKGVWKVGFLLYLLLMGEAFTGYILPWHQMSYWAATVLTSIIESLPFVGPRLYRYVVGGFSVSGVTLIRVLSVHIWLGFIILGLMVIHMYYLHKKGSRNPLYSFYYSGDVVYFHSYFTIKDFFLFMVFGSFVIVWLFLNPDLLLDIESYLEADPLSTPVSIKPEWYFLAFYTILRCIGSKIGGIVLILSFLFFLWVPTNGGSSVYRLVRQVIFWFIIRLFVSLTYLGGCHPEYPYLIVGQLFSVFLVMLMFIYKVFSL